MKRYVITSSDMFGRDLVVADEDGKQIEGIREFTITGYPREPMRLAMELNPQGMNMLVVLTDVTFTCPGCSETISHECGGDTLGDQALGGT